MASKSHLLKKLRSFGAIAALSLLAACEGGVTLDQVAGHYEGFVVTQASSTATPASRSAAQVHSSVSAEIKKTSATSVSVTLHAQGQSIAPTIEARFGMKGRMALSSSTGFFPGDVELVNTSGNCFTDASKNQMCLGGREIQLAFASLGTKIVLDKMAATQMPAFEDPQSYTIDQLVARAKTQNFDNQVQFENVVQARLTARTAYLNLLPHINIGVGLNGISAALGAIPAALLLATRSVGDLLPFFLPTRWYQAEADTALASVQDDAYKIVQASSMNIMQGLGLSVLRDEQALERMNENKLAMIEVRDEILANEHNGAGDIQIGSADQIEVVINGLDRAIEALQETVREEKTALSQGAGFMNPQAVDLIEPIAVGPVTGPIPGTLADWQKLATDRSIDLVQMDDMAVYASKMRAVRKFQWLDPSGDDQGSIGFGLVDYLAIGSSMVRQVYDKKNSTESLLMKKVADTLTQSGDMYHDYRLELEAVQLNQRLIDRFIMNFHSGIAFNMSDLANALAGKAAAEIAEVDDEYAFLVLQAQMDFLTFSGPYALLGEGIH